MVRHFFSRSNFYGLAGFGFIPGKCWAVFGLVFGLGNLSVPGLTVTRAHVACQICRNPGQEPGTAEPESSQSQCLQGLARVGMLVSNQQTPRKRAFLALLAPPAHDRTPSLELYPHPTHRHYFKFFFTNFKKQFRT